MMRNYRHVAIADRLLLSALLFLLALLPSVAHAQYQAFAYGVNFEVGQYGCYSGLALGVSSVSASCSGGVGNTSHTASASASGRLFNGAVSVSGAVSYFAYSTSQVRYSDYLMFTGAATPAQLYFYLAFSASMTSGSDQYGLEFGRIAYGSANAEVGSVSNYGAPVINYSVNATAIGDGVFRIAATYQGDQAFALLGENLARIDNTSAVASASSTLQFLGIDAVDANGGSLAGTIDCTFRDSGQACNLGLIDAPLTATPEPASIALLGTGLLAVFGIGQRKRFNKDS